VKNLGLGAFLSFPLGCLSDDSVGQTVFRNTMDLLLSCTMETDSKLNGRKMRFLLDQFR
jgi:hypothetical protein